MPLEDGVHWLEKRGVSWAFMKTIDMDIDIEEEEEEEVDMGMDMEVEVEEPIDMSIVDDAMEVAIDMPDMVVEVVPMSIPVIELMSIVGKS